MMKGLIFCLGLCCALPASAQTPFYTLSTSQGTYSNLSAPTQLVNGTWDDPSFKIAIPFYFEYFGIKLDSLISDEAIGCYFLGSVVSNKTPLILVYLADLIDRGNATGQHLSFISYQVFGPPGNQRLCVEWRNAGFFGDVDDDGLSIDFVNVQFWLHEGTNVIEIAFGPNSITQPGICFELGNGPGIGLLKWINLTTEVISPESLVLGGAAFSPALFVTDEISALVGTPPAGTIYRFERNTSSLSETFADSGLMLSPNPTHFGFRVATATGAETLPVQVIDALGRVVVQGKTNQFISVETLPSGTFFVRVARPDGAIAVDKLLVVH